jgi:protein TonB
MLQTQNIHMRPATRSPQQRMMTIAIVAAFHVAVIATFVVALGHNWIPTLTRPDPTVFVPPAPPTPTQHSPQTKLKLIDPTVPSVKTPELAVKEESHLQPLAPPPNGAEGQGNTQDLPTRSPVALFSTHTTPPYPLLQRRLGNEGNVELRLTIDADGEVTDAAIVRSSGYDELDRAAASWVRAHWRYLPALQNGLAVASTTNALVTFRLTSR